MRKKEPFKPQVFKLAKNLPKLIAYRISKSKSTRDFRGFNYDPKTGIAKLI